MKKIGKNRLSREVRVFERISRGLWNEWFIEMLLVDNRIHFLLQLEDG